MIYSMLMQLKAQRYMNFEIGQKSTIYVVGILFRFKNKLLHTVRKFKNIPITQILREINIDFAKFILQDLQNYQKETSDSEIFMKFSALTCTQT